ncbi:hypothetical protein D3C85_1209050 [compost metagenome]
MKKSALVGVVVALGAVWTGTAWYTGQKAEAFVNQSIESANVELAKAGEQWGIAAVAELVSFERGVFSSTARYRMKFTVPAAEGKPAQERDLLFVEHLDHGVHAGHGGQPLCAGRDPDRQGMVRRRQGRHAPVGLVQRQLCQEHHGQVRRGAGGIRKGRHQPGVLGHEGRYRIRHRHQARGHLPGRRQPGAGGSLGHQRHRAHVHAGHHA